LEPGVYYSSHFPVPLQLVVISKLEGQEKLIFGSIRVNLSVAILKELYAELQKYGGKVGANLLAVVCLANPEER
jgi:hypothetical protein